MKSWANIPFEILVIIFSHLDCVPDIIQAQLVCKSWHQASQERLYKNIAIRGGKISVAKKLIESLKIANQGRLVKCLDLETCFFSKDLICRQSAVDVFETLFSLCPNIQIINAVNDTVAPLYQFIKKNRHLLPFLQRIPKPKYSKDMDMYLHTAFVCCKSLKYLYLGDINSPFLHESTVERVSLLNQLDNFKSLTHLELLSTSSESIFELERVVNRCVPSLETISFTNYFSAEMFMHQHTNFLKNSIRPLPNIKTFQCRNMPLRDPIVHYIMHKFPKLSDLMIKTFNPNFYLAKKQPKLGMSARVLSALFKYSSRLHRFDLFVLLTPDEVFNWVKGFHTHALNRNSNEVSTFLKVEYSNDMLPDSYPHLHLMKNPSIQFRNENVDLGLSINNQANVIEIGYIVNFNELVLPHTEIIRQCGSKLKGMKLSMRATQDLYTHNGNVGDITESSDLINGLQRAALNDLNDVLLYCPFLTHLSLYDMYLFQSTTIIEKRNTSIANLHIEASVILPDILYQLSSCLPSLKCVMFSSCDMIFQDYFTGGAAIAIVYVNMPYTSFEKMIWKKPPSNSQRFNCYICVTALGIRQYFRGDEVSLCNSTHEEFNKMRDNATPFAYHFEISCTSIRSFTFQFNEEFCMEYQLNEHLATRVPV